MRVRVECKGYGDLDIDHIHPFQGDLKDLSEENYEKLKNEILEQGFSAPFFIWEGKNEILDGTQRHRVLSRMRGEGFDIPLLPFVPIKAKTRKQAKEKLLAFASQYGNMTSQGLYEFASEAGIKFDEISNRFRFPEIDFDKFESEYYEENSSGSSAADDVPDTRTTFIRTGDLLLLGNHRVLCGDSTLEQDVGRLLGEELIDMVFTDPPYNIAYEGKTKNKLKIENDEMESGVFRDFLSKIYKNLFAKMRPGAPIYVCHADSERINFTELFKLSGFKMSSIVIWNKNVSTFGRQDYFWKHEPIIYGWKEGAAHKWYGPNNEVSVWDIDRPSKSEEHPTMKPIALVERALNNSSQKENVVFDSFLGSGSTLIACEKNNRKCFGIEIDPIYCDVIVRRWQDFSGKVARVIRGETEIDYNELGELKTEVKLRKKNAKGR